MYSSTGLTLSLTVYNDGPEVMTTVPCWTGSTTFVEFEGSILTTVNLVHNSKEFRAAVPGKSYTQCPGPY